MKIYTLEEARLMHSIGIKMKYIPHGTYENIGNIVMRSATTVTAKGAASGKEYILPIRDSWTRWEIADDN